MDIRHLARQRGIEAEYRMPRTVRSTPKVPPVYLELQPHGVWYARSPHCMAGGDHQVLAVMTDPIEAMYVAYRTLRKRRSGMVWNKGIFVEPRLDRPTYTVRDGRRFAYLLEEPIIYDWTPRGYRRS